MLESKTMLKSFGIAIISFLLASCENPFQFSLYDADTSDSNVNEKNIERIISSKDVNDTLTIAAFADSHNYYEELRKAVNLINTRNDVDFVIVAGDVTETGLLNQYESYLREIKKLTQPVITIIGNHDFLSNGSIIYKKLFGPENFFFDYENYRFVGFNDNVWENNNTAPNFEWLNKVLANQNSNPIVIAHIQPWTDEQLGETYSQEYEKIIETNKVILSIGGHCHGFSHTIKNNIHYLIAGSVSTGGISLIKICNAGVKIERVNF